MLAAAGFCVSLGLASCEDYLTVLPTDKITEQDFWKDKNDLNNVRASAYRQFATQAVTDRIVHWASSAATILRSTTCPAPISRISSRAS